MSELNDLYQEMILDHSKRPRHRHAMESPPARKAEGFNPLCGDRVQVYVALEGDRIREVSFEGSGCAISTASASLMAEALEGKTPAEARAMFERFKALVTGHEPAADEDLGKLEVLGGVARYPMRVKCATLPWHTLKAALENQSQPVTTE